jgi:hypothetical protein
VESVSERAADATQASTAAAAISLAGGNGSRPTNTARSPATAPPDTVGGPDLVVGPDPVGGPVLPAKVRERLASIPTNALRHPDVRAAETAYRSAAYAQEAARDAYRDAREASWRVDRDNHDQVQRFRYGEVDELPEAVRAAGRAQRTAMEHYQRAEAAAEQAWRALSEAIAIQDNGQPAPATAAVSFTPAPRAAVASGPSPGSNDHPTAAARTAASSTADDHRPAPRTGARHPPAYPIPGSAAGPPTRRSGPASGP